MSLCKLHIIGNTGQDKVEIKYSGKGLAIGSFSVAVNDKIDDKPITNWFKVVAFGRLAEYLKDADWFAKGTQVYVSGKLQIKPWQDRDGNQRIDYEVIAEDIFHFGKAAGTSPAPSPKEQPKKSSSNDDDFEIPF